MSIQSISNTNYLCFVSFKDVGRNNSDLEAIPVIPNGNETIPRVLSLTTWQRIKDVVRRIFSCICGKQESRKFAAVSHSVMRFYENKIQPHLGHYNDQQIQNIRLTLFGLLQRWDKAKLGPKTQAVVGFLRTKIQELSSHQAKMLSDRVTIPLAAAIKEVSSKSAENKLKSAELVQKEAQLKSREQGLESRIRELNRDKIGVEASKLELDVQKQFLDERERKLKESENGLAQRRAQVEALAKKIEQQKNNPPVAQNPPVANVDVKIVPDGNSLPAVAKQKAAGPVGTPPKDKDNPIDKIIGQYVEMRELNNFVEGNKNGKWDFSPNEIVIALCPNNNLLEPLKYQIVRIISKEGEGNYKVNNGTSQVIMPKSAFWKLKTKYAPVPAVVSKPAEFGRPKVFTEPPMAPGEDDYIPDSEDVGGRTIMTYNFAEGFAKEYNADDRTLTYNAKTYRILNGNVTNFSQPLVSVGSTAGREVIEFDPANSLYIQDHLKKFKAELEEWRNILGTNLRTVDVLSLLKEYLRKEVFKLSHNDQANNLVMDMVTEALKSDSFKKLKHISKEGYPSDIPIIPLDEFVKRGIGVCRHHGLLTAYFINELCKGPNPHLDGIVHHIRDNVYGGAHVWDVFIPKAKKKGDPVEKWHIDTLWDVLENFGTKLGEKKILSIPNYLPEQVLRRQEIRTHPSARKMGQAG